MYYNSRAVIIKSVDYAENDKILTVFTEAEGKVKAVAKGVKKAGSSLRICVQPFCHSFLHFRRGKDMEQITQGKLLDFYGEVRDDINCALQAMYIMEILDHAVMLKDPHPELYENLLKVLALLNGRGYNPLFIRYFEIQLLIVLGYAPTWDRCVACGRKKTGSTHFNIEGGGMVCGNCRAGFNNTFILSEESLGILRLLSKTAVPVLARIKASEAALRQLENFLEKYMQYHLGKDFKMKNTIKNLQKIIPM
ncbi:MAG: DNA repair protein RecO [Syntrophomonadaceae bacterium]|jgi:DNA repair protein RecO (recombination protein O)|nr:DNA repair protein RecO [Syntrophomonadaceae bacterium]